MSDPYDPSGEKENELTEEELVDDLADSFENDDVEDDGQPTMYEEYQDLYGGDDWDHGQFDDFGEW